MRHRDRRLVCGARRGPGDRAREGLASDRGSATIWSVGAVAVLCVVFGVVLALGQAVVIRHRTAGGADLAALAAADHWAEGGAMACARAARVARAQGARLVRCEVVGDIAEVTAASGRGPFTARVRARAGPPTATATATATQTPTATDGAVSAEGTGRKEARRDSAAG
ncbi:Rv3654c family TadE-like protein [Streptomyces sp. NPDC017943]|uniref:Rv3654c family TadE-like protein n=1 Tax=Streptomyces sp. NPDC017943 TaxID=3365019 RepID=UPI00379087DD